MRRLGTSDLAVSPGDLRSLGGRWLDVGRQRRVRLDRGDPASIDHGVTTIDTAAVYGQGYGEEVVGKAIRGLRDRVPGRHQVRDDLGPRAGGSDPWATQDRLGKDVVIRRNSSPETIPSSASGASNGWASTSSTSTRSTGPTPPRRSKTRWPH